MPRRPTSTSRSPTTAGQRRAPVDDDGCGGPRALQPSPARRQRLRCRARPDGRPPSRGRVLGAAAIASRRERAIGESARVQRRSSASCSRVGSARRSRSRRNAARRSRTGTRAVALAGRATLTAGTSISSATSTAREFCARSAPLDHSVRARPRERARGTAVARKSQSKSTSPPIVNTRCAGRRHSAIRRAQATIDPDGRCPSRAARSRSAAGRASRPREARHRRAAAFDEHRATAARASSASSAARSSRPPRRGSATTSAAPCDAPHGAVVPIDEQRLRAPSANTRACARSLRRGSMITRSGFSPSTWPHREQRVIMLDRARAHDHRVAERAQPMQMHDIVGPRHEVRIAARGRDAAVQALAEMRDRERPPPRGRAGGAYRSRSVRAAAGAPGATLQPAAPDASQARASAGPGRHAHAACADADCGALEADRIAGLGVARHGAGHGRGRQERPPGRLLQRLVGHEWGHE